MQIKNLYSGVCAADKLPAEDFQTLLAHRGCRLERIVSTGHSTPPDQWYDQDDDEWVLLLSGCAVLRFAGPDETVTLGPGDHLLIPAHRRHRVESTDPQGATVWLALHMRPEP